MENRANKVEKNQEIEIKIALDQSISFGDIDDVLGCYRHEPWQEIHMVADYLDTEDGDLNKMQLAYRLRRENEKKVATLKAGKVDAAGVAHRHEVNVDVTSMESDLSVFYKDEKFGSLLQTLAGKKMVSQLKMDFMRLASVFDYGSSKIEVAVDRGMIIKGSKTAPIWELELELKEGLIEDMIRLKQAVTDFFQVEVAVKSKFQRGMEL